jgi:hypothetical protein
MIGIPPSSPPLDALSAPAPIDRNSAKKIAADREVGGDERWP